MHFFPEIHAIVSHKIKLMCFSPSIKFMAFFHDRIQNISNSLASRTIIEQKLSSFTVRPKSNLGGS